MINDPNPNNPSHANNLGNSTNKPDELQELLLNFDQLYLIKDSIHLEYELLQSAKRYDLPLESVRQMFKDYSRQQQETIGRNSPLLSLIYRIERSFEWLNQSMSQMDLFPVLEYLSKLSIIVALLVFIHEIPERAEQREAEQKRTNYEAWRIILAREGKRASAGRIDALQDLNKQKIPLSNTNLSNAFLSDIQLPNARLDGVIFNGAVLNRANLQGVYLVNAQLQKTGLINANLQNAKLFGADMRGANLSGADFTKADLKGADLKKADFTEAKGLTSAQLREAKNWQFACYDTELSKQLGLNSAENLCQ